jgi:hypothetical protein
LVAIASAQGVRRKHGELQEHDAVHQMAAHDGAREGCEQQQVQRPGTRSTLCAGRGARRERADPRCQRQRQAGGGVDVVLAAPWPGPAFGRHRARTVAQHPDEQNHGRREARPGRADSKRRAPSAAREEHARRRRERDRAREQCQEIQALGRLLRVFEESHRRVGPAAGHD